MRFGLLRHLALVGLFALGACTHSDLRPDFVRQATTALPVAADAPLVAYTERLRSGHGADSGFRLLSDSMDALLARVVLADRAKYSIDLQYYLFFGDATGKLIAQRLLAAADRGVRVRMLLDDLHQTANDEVLRALDGHPNIEIRLFNPFHERTASMWGMGKQFAGDFSRLNRRMHNKTFTVDGAASVVGGRNIGDDYFDASPGVNFRDLDTIAIGPVVAEISRSFDTYWNSEPSVPVAAFRSHADTPVELAAIRAALAKNAREIQETQYAQSVFARAGDLVREDPAQAWAWGAATFLSDDPVKVNPDVESADLHMAPRLREWLDASRHRILLISPYFVPGDKGVAYLEAKRSAGIDVAVLTNSLASTDAGNVYAAYAAYRPKLLASGVKLYELKPNAARAKHSHFVGSSSSGSSLHAKSIVIDDNRAFVGSLNLDPRSRNLNTEDGVIVESPVLAKSLADMFAFVTGPAGSYSVELKPGSTNVVWTTVEDGKTVTYDDAPQTSAWRRFKVGMTRIIPIEGLL